MLQAEKSHTPSRDQLESAYRAIYAVWIRYLSHAEALEQAEQFVRQFESRR